MQAAAVAVVRASQYKNNFCKNNIAPLSKGFFYLIFFGATGANGGGGGGGGAGGIGGAGGTFNSSIVGFCGGSGICKFTSGTGGGGGGGTLCLFCENAATEKNSTIPVRQIFNRFIIKIFAMMQSSKKIHNLFYLLFCICLL